MTKLLASTAETNRMLAQGKGSTIDLAMVREIPRLLIDPHKIEHVLNNLLSNTIKASEPSTVVKIGLKSDGQWVATAVQDQGQGIPEQEQEKLFQPFSKTRVRSTAGEGSSGLRRRVLEPTA